jgi:hypothetical protein
VRLDGEVPVTGALLAAVLSLRSSRRGRRVGTFVIATAALWPGSWAGVGHLGAGPFLSWVDATVVWCLFGTGLLSFPDELRQSGRELRFLVGMWAVVLSGPRRSRCPGTLNEAPRPE